ncbi:MAG: hypothetical protein AOY29_05870 [Alcanivorax borkumensis]|nr:MAG: hypothetical protein AOY29_05870 [Alcanivorax borkumensis]
MIPFCRFSASIVLLSFLAFLLVFKLLAYAMLRVLAVAAALLCLAIYRRVSVRLPAERLFATD